MYIDPKLTNGMDPNMDPECYTYIAKGVDPAKAYLVAIDLVKREGWGAMEPLKPPELIPGEYPRVVIVYYDIGFNPCHNAEECVSTVQEIQKHHMHDLGLPDIAYNFLIGGDGRVYEGRGYTNNPSKLGDKWTKYENKSFDIAFIGRFDDDKLPYPDMREAAVNLLQQATLNQYVDYFFDLVEDKAPSKYCIDECPYPAPDPEPGDPVVDFDAIGY